MYMSNVTDNNTSQSDPIGICYICSQYYRMHVDQTPRQVDDKLGRHRMTAAWPRMLPAAWSLLGVKKQESLSVLTKRG